MSTFKKEPADWPSDWDAEDHLLGAMLLNGRAISDAVEVLGGSGDHFDRPSCRLIYRAMVGMHDYDERVDGVTLAEKLRAQGTLEEVGGAFRLHTLVALVPAASMAKNYAAIVLDAWKRRLIDQLAYATREQIQAGLTGDEMFGQLDQALVNLRSQIDIGRGTVYSAKELADMFMHDVTHRTEIPPGVVAPFGFLQPMQKGRLYVLGGYTADGKTVVGAQYLISAARQNFRVGFVSLEMSKEQLRDRILAALGIPYEFIIARLIPERMRLRFDAAVKAFSLMQVDVIDDPSANAARIGGYQRAGRYDLLIVDHLHRIDWSERRDLEREVVAMTNVAKRYEVPLLTLVQLSRGVGADPFPRPTLRSLRETSIIEQEASRVDFIWRKRDERQLPTVQAEYIVAKNRFGTTRAWELAFNGDEVRFDEPGTTTGEGA